MTATIAAALVAVLAACGSNPAASPGQNAGEPVSGGNLVYLASYDNPDFQWTDVNDWEPGIIFSALVDRLVYWDAKSSTLRPWLAESWTANPDSTQFTLKIRKGVTFSDGSALNAQVVADNLTIKGKGDKALGIPGTYTWPAGFESATVTDADTVAVKFSRPAYGFIRALTFYHSGIVGEKTLKLSFQDSSDIKNLVGSGPFVFDSYTPGEQYVLNKRKDYDWAPDGVGHTGSAYLDKITVRIAGQNSVRTGLLQSGQADVIRDVPTADEQRLGQTGFTVLPAKQIAYSVQIRVRPNSAATADVRVRQAIQHAVNRKELVDTLYFTDIWKPATSVIESGVPGWVDLSAKLTNDVDKANNLLDQAGWTARDPQGFRTKDGQRLSFLVYSVSWIRQSQPELLLLAQQLKKVGVELTVKNVDSNNETAAVGAPGVSLSISLGSVPTVSGPMRNNFHSAVTTSWFNSGALAKDTELDGHVDALSNATDDAGYTKAVSELQNYLIDQAYVIPLDTNQQTFAVAKKVHDLNVDAYGRLFFYDAWLSK
nr:TIGR04028 family ABC transporter substrate-binding protein [Dactylosporangium thailandense]